MKKENILFGVIGLLAGLIRRENRWGAETDTALLRADAILHDPCALAASAQPEPETGQFVVPYDVVVSRFGLESG